MTDPMKNWGYRLKEILDRRGNPKKIALAAELGVNSSAISRWLSGDSISTKNLIDLCIILDVSSDWLLMNRGYPDLHNADRASCCQICHTIRHIPPANIQELARFLNCLGSNNVSEPN